MMKIWIKDIQEKSFVSITARADIPRINVTLSRHWPDKQNRKGANNLKKEEKVHNYDGSETS